MRKKLFLSTMAILLASGSQSFAAGYSTSLYSTSGLGNSYAGSVTGSHDVSDLFFNPAIATDLKTSQFVAGIDYLKISVKTHGDEANLHDAGARIPVPYAYLATPINDRTSLNLAVTSPFGLGTKYSDEWAGRYITIKSAVATVNINPSISYKICDNLSIGAGVMAQYYDALLTQGVYTGGSDALARLSANGWGYGYNLGVNYKLNDQLKFGMGYRSKIGYNLQGSVKVPALAMRSDIQAKTITPESLTAGTAYKINQDVELVYDVTWTRWSRLKELSVTADQIPTLGNRANFNWGDSYMNSVGANFAAGQDSIVRVGLAYEKGGVTDANREPRVPNGNKVWTSIGFNKKIGNGWSVDAAYLRQFFRPSKMSTTDVNKNTINVSYKNTVDVIGLGIKKNF